MSTTRPSHARPLATPGALAGRAGHLGSSLPSRSWPCIAAVLLLVSLSPSRLAAQTIHAVEIAAASQRFGIPEAWIRAVMRAESAGDRHAVSHRGAMGLMQVMPATWAGLRAQHGLGADPFMPQDNILAGTAYLREMLDRFGSVPLMLAAYNAGPRRVEMHLATGQPLPAETRAYVAILAPLLTGDAGTVAPGQLAVRAVRGADGIFVRPGSEDMEPPRSIFVPVAGATIAADTPPAQPFVGRSRAAEAHEADGSAGHRGSIFAVRRSSGGAP
ncbi:lytic transglycosylase domain-containing protein [Roseomonas eburnea]|uniref:Lytic transglycosylase domain-containing protein n=1 Tax=Neoroseomonas eburnea TaxID=1346889 RepID=A0A9X9XGN1_9PROT|nr:lytic transglycosylase domain-containing protein [Neoroseomonas eburnea]